MPRRILQYSRTEPARSILFVVALMTGLAQAATFFLATPWFLALPNAVIVIPICLWAMWSAVRSNQKHMARSAFWLSLLWCWTGLMRLIIVPGVGELLWIPFLVVSAAMGIVYLYFAYHRKVGDL